MKLGIIAKSLKKTNFLSMIRESLYHTESTVDLLHQEAPCHFMCESKCRKR